MGAFLSKKKATEHSTRIIVYASKENSSIDIIECEIKFLKVQPYYPEYYIDRARLRSFDDWPKKLNQKPDDMSDAGFYYTQKDDRVICFCCGLGLHSWDENDDPWEQHALHQVNCEYLLTMKGTDYIESIKSKFPVDEHDTINLSTLFKED